MIFRTPRASRSGQASGPLSGWNQVTKPSTGNNGIANGTQLNAHPVPIVPPPISSKIAPLPESTWTNRTPLYIHGIEGSSVIANNSKGGTLTITEGFQDTDLIDKLIDNASVELQDIDTSQAERRQMLGAAINLLESFLPSPDFEEGKAIIPTKVSNLEDLVAIASAFDNNPTRTLATLEDWPSTFNIGEEGNYEIRVEENEEKKKLVFAFPSEEEKQSFIALLRATSQQRHPYLILSVDRILDNRKLKLSVEIPLNQSDLEEAADPTPTEIDPDALAADDAFWPNFLSELAEEI